MGLLKVSGGEVVTKPKVVVSFTVKPETLEDIRQFKKNHKLKSMSVIIENLVIDFMKKVEYEEKNKKLNEVEKKETEV